jgi:aryl-alcohol dehydrogenase-like predicted oxidoreductase
VPAPLQAAARRLGTTPDAVALAAALAQPWADVVLSGAATPAMLHSNLAAVDLDVHAVLDDLLAALGEPPDAYWQRRSELPWT